MIKKPELLAPAGSKESLIGAINAGANAIYLAGKRFGARAYANNFDETSLIDMIHYAHLRGVFVYVAINTVIFDDEVDDLLNYADMLANHHVDAFIMQDLGMIDLFFQRYPHVDIHVSTQANTHTLDQVLWLKSRGVKRIVMARETSLEVIKRIKKHVDIELEVFIHGALCVSYSGQCLMSSMIGGRSGNRGECAQPCRLPYVLYKENQKISDSSYLLSTKDLMTLDHLDDLIDANIDSLKIEGRMRKPEYVIQTVLSYRKALDAAWMKKKAVLDEDILRLKQVFNREYTKGYLFDEEPNQINQDFRPNHMGIPVGEVIDMKDHKAIIKLSDRLSVNDGYRIVGKKDVGNIVSRILMGNTLVKTAEKGSIIKLDLQEDVYVGSLVLKTLDNGLEESLKRYLDPNYKLISLSGKVYAYMNQPLRFEITDGINQVNLSSEDILSEAKSAPLSKEKLADQMSKLGSTPYVMTNLEILTDESSFLPMSSLNEVRRKAIDELSQLRINRQPQSILTFSNIPIENQKIHPHLWAVKVRTIDQYEAAKLKQVPIIYVEDILDFKDDSIIPVKKRIQTIESTIQKEALIQDIGLLYRYKDHDLITDEALNVTNSHTVHLLHTYGAKRITLSPEVSKQRIESLYQTFEKQFGYTPNLELVVYGHEELMITKYCPIAKTYKTKPHCHLCEIKQYYLEDRMGLRFPLINDGHCNLRLLHSKPLNLFSYLYDMQLLPLTYRLNFTIESREEVEAIIDQFIQSRATRQDVINKKTTTGRFIA
ncbi:MAG: U32 family peptidase [Acholeplasma sp.]|jgi:putative protease|nr:MAG: U32 family peptidase [Acholeplasma sp.]